MLTGDEPPSTPPHQHHRPFCRVSGQLPADHLLQSGTEANSNASTKPRTLHHDTDTTGSSMRVASCARRCTAKTTVLWASRAHRWITGPTLTGCALPPGHLHQHIITDGRRSCITSNTSATWQASPRAHIKRHTSTEVRCDPDTLPSWHATAIVFLHEHSFNRSCVWSFCRSGLWILRTNR